MSYSKHAGGVRKPGASARPQIRCEIFKRNQVHYLDSPTFWTSFLRFETEQPATEESEKVIDDVLQKSKLAGAVVQDTTQHREGTT